MQVEAGAGGFNDGRMQSVHADPGERDQHGRRHDPGQATGRPLGRGRRARFDVMALTVAVAARALEPLAQPEQAFEVGDGVRYMSGLWRAEPGALFLFDKTLERGVGLEGHDQKRGGQRGKHATVILARGGFEHETADVHQWKRQQVGEQQ